jgi:hypothetical protein
MAPLPSSPVTRLRHLLALLRERDAFPAPNPSSSNLVRRQNADSDPNLGLIIPTTYVGETTDMAPGEVAGIVLGAILGFLLLVWLIMWAVASNAPFETTEEVIEVRNRRSPSRRRSRRSSHRSDVHVERRSREHSPRRRGAQIVEERVVEERYPVQVPGLSEIRVSRGPSPSPPPPPPPPPFRDEIIVEDRRPRRHSRDEEVVVIEDGTTDYSSDLPPRRKSKRRSSGYRPVEPDRYAGGDHPRRPVDRRYG